MLPQDLAAEMDAAVWPVPKVLSWLKYEGKIEHEEHEEFAPTHSLHGWA